jgi:hypothetical protein
MKPFIIVLMSLILAGCDSSSEYNDSLSARQDREARKLCIEKGGVPITSEWSGIMKDCKFSKSVSK